MIVQWFAQMFYKVFTGLLNWISLPSLDTTIREYIEVYVDLIKNGVFLFEFFIPKILVKIGLPIIIGVTVFKYGYYFVMWILKKIPAVGIE